MSQAKAFIDGKWIELKGFKIHSASESNPMEDAKDHMFDGSVRWATEYPAEFVLIPMEKGEDGIWRMA